MLKNPTVTHIYVLLMENLVVTPYFFLSFDLQQEKESKLQNVFGFLSLSAGQEII